MTPGTVPSLVARLDDRPCSRCWLCLPSCDAGALMRVGGEADLLLDPWACRGCGDCVLVCPQAALALAPRGRRMTEPEAFLPQVTAFTCNYCGYMAADTAGALREQYPANVKLIRLPCTGKTDVQYLLDAFEQGADAVFVVGCSLGNCHHVRGNERGRARVARARDLLQQIGLEPERLQMYFVSGGMGATFARIAQGMTARALALGPNPLRTGISTVAEARPSTGPTSD